MLTAGSVVSCWSAARKYRNIGLEENRMGTYKTHESAWIEECVRKELAPGIHTAECSEEFGTDQYVLWLELLPDSTLRQVRFSKADYQSGDWKETVQAALEEMNK